MPLRSPSRRRRNGSPLSHRYGIVPHEMFAVMSMEASSNRLKLKLDMVFRDLPAEEAQKRFAEFSEAPEGEKADGPVGMKVVGKLKRQTKKELLEQGVAPETLGMKPKRKTVKALVPK